jgi:hypothetical protein
VTESNSTSLLESAVELRLIRRIATDSAKAINDLFDDDRGCYWRDTEQRKTESADTPEFFPTVTYRSTEALLDLIFRHPDWLADQTATIYDRIRRVLSRPLADTQSALDIPGNPFRNPFTTALYLITACRANKLLTKEGGAVVQPSNIEEAVELLLDACLNEESPYSSDRHPFIEFHILRAIITATPKQTGDRTEEGIAPSCGDMIQRVNGLRARIIENVKTDTERLLARHMLNQITPGDSVALVFCAATLAHGDDTDIRHYVLPALTVGFGAQDAAGCWPLGRVIRRNRDKRGQRAWEFIISTYEIAWAASDTLLKLLRHPETALVEKARSRWDCLLLAGRYAERSAVELPSKESPKRGWCSDPPYGQLLIESWTSANVLQSIISLGELRDEKICSETLKTFVSLDPRSRDWPSWKRWKKLKEEAEPEDENRIIEYLDNKIVRPILNDPRRLPSAKDETVSVLLFGPPGTSKTTVAHGIADGLGWPIVMLSPGDFIEKGLEFIEAQARQVFERLHKLHRVVVLFDECDELFRDRQPSNANEQMRNITAFVTASMLPKLQDLHDRGRVVFCICTNKFGTLDPAIKRGGRIDHVVAVGPPQRELRDKMIKEALSEVSSGAKDVAIGELSLGTNGFVRREILRTCEIVLSSVGDWNDTDSVSEAVNRAVTRVGQSRMIPVEEYNDFKKDQKQFSHPVIQG